VTVEVRAPALDVPARTSAAATATAETERIYPRSVMDGTLASKA
jgi:hypothetical protein